MARLSILARDQVFLKIFFYFWLHWALIAVCGLSLVAVSRGYSLIALHGLLTAVASPGSTRLSGRDTQA